VQGSLGGRAGWRLGGRWPWVVACGVARAVLRAFCIGKTLVCKLFCLLKTTGGSLLYQLVAASQSRDGALAVSLSMEPRVDALAEKTRAQQCQNKERAAKGSALTKKRDCGGANRKRPTHAITDPEPSQARSHFRVMLLGIADPRNLSWWTETDLRTDSLHQSDAPLGLTWCS